MQRGWVKDGAFLFAPNPGNSIAGVRLEQKESTCVNVSMLYFDPPYNISLDYNKGVGRRQHYGGSVDDSKPDDEYKTFLKNIIGNGLEISKMDTHVFVWCDLFYPRPTKSSLHPTMKPIPLLRNLILNSTNINEVVYDCFLGSGSTLIACEQTHRVCLGVELDIEYCQTVMDRFEKLTKIQPTLLYE
ncbi:MAG: site-specific DNA-methyltransferase [Candidatus Paceibacterota bacterium]